MSAVPMNDDLLARAQRCNAESDVVLARIRPRTGRVSPEEVTRLKAEAVASMERTPRPDARPARSPGMRRLMRIIALLVGGSN